MEFEYVVVIYSWFVLSGNETPIYQTRGVEGWSRLFIRPNDRNDIERCKQSGVEKKKNPTQVMHTFDRLACNSSAFYLSNCHPLFIFNSTVAQRAAVKKITDVGSWTVQTFSICLQHLSTPARSCGNTSSCFCTRPAVAAAALGVPTHCLTLCQ